MDSCGSHSPKERVNDVKKFMKTYEVINLFGVLVVCLSVCLFFIIGLSHFHFIV